MNCIIVDDEPVARKGMKSLIEQVPQLELAGSFNNAVAASAFMSGHTVDLIFLDIQMPGITGMEFAQSIPRIHWSSSPLHTLNMPLIAMK